MYIASVWFANTGLEVILSAFMGAIMAQLLKMLFYYRQHKKLNFRILVETGGMPSSHSAFVVGMATSVAAIKGGMSVEFAIALGVALIVMYDAAGLRRAAGKMARVLNNIVDDMYQDKPQDASEKLIELLGHTPIEVIMGASLGFVMALALNNVLN
jgi:hypothetical protein